MHDDKKPPDFNRLAAINHLVHLLYCLRNAGTDLIGPGACYPIEEEAGRKKIYNDLLDELDRYVTNHLDGLKKLRL